MNEKIKVSIIKGRIFKSLVEFVSHACISIFKRTTKFSPPELDPKKELRTAAETQALYFVLLSKGKKAGLSQPYRGKTKAFPRCPVVTRKIENQADRRIFCFS